MYLFGAGVALLLDFGVELRSRRAFGRLFCQFGALVEAPCPFRRFFDIFGLCRVVPDRCFLCACAVNRQARAKYVQNCVLVECSGAFLSFS